MWSCGYDNWLAPGILKQPAPTSLILVSQKNKKYFSSNRERGIEFTTFLHTDNGSGFQKK